MRTPDSFGCMLVSYLGGGRRRRAKLARISCSLFFLAPIVSECVKAEKGREGEMGRTDEVTRQSRLLLCFGRHLASPDGRRTAIRPRLLLRVRGRIETDEIHLHDGEVNA